MSFTKNLFLIECESMNPFVTKGDVVIYEPMRIGYPIVQSIYLIEFKGEKMIARVQLLIKGGMNLIFDGDAKGLIELEQHEREQVIFIGHVIGRVLKSGEVIKRFSIYENTLSI